MPSREDCPHCPFKDNPNVDCTVLKTGHTRFCQLIDPANPSYRPKAVDSVISMTMENYKPDSPKVLPTLTQQAKNLTRSISRYIKSGGGVVSQEVKQKRLAICRGCEFYEPEEQRCLECGCYLQIKASLPSETCPLEIPKWGAEPVKQKNRPMAGGGCGCSNKK
jgi:hypothetical protein